MISVEPNSGILISEFSIRYIEDWLRYQADASRTARSLQATADYLNQHRATPESRQAWLDTVNKAKDLSREHAILMESEEPPSFNQVLARLNGETADFVAKLNEHEIRLLA
jgi:hypothetical protein